MSNFAFETLAIPGPMLIRPRRFGDARGYFMETYSLGAYREAGIGVAFVQDNQSLSEKRGVLRGLHFQKPPAMQAKLVRVLRGAIFDVAVDLRQGSAHYGRWCAATLTGEGAEQLYVPAGFAHGFCTLEDATEVAYKVDSPYAPEQEGALAWDDPAIAIDWPVARDEVILSAKDTGLPGLAQFETPFTQGAMR